MTAITASPGRRDWSGVVVLTTENDPYNWNRLTKWHAAAAASGRNWTTALAVAGSTDTVLAPQSTESSTQKP